MRETEGIGFDGIARPPRIYLDTNHMINIANVRKGKKLPPGQSEDDYRRINECVKSYCGLIFNPYATLEWVEGNATEESASRIAAVVDSAQVKYMIEADYLGVYTQEVLAQCQKQKADIRVPNLPPVLQNISDNRTFQSTLGILVRDVPGYLEKDKLEQIQRKGELPTTVPALSAGEWTKESFIWKQKNEKLYQERVTGFIDSLSEDIARRDEYFSNPKQYRIDWIKRLLKIDKILKAFNPGIDIDTILEKIDIEDCQAINLYWTVREKRMRSGHPPNDNDVDDYVYIPIIPYADIVLIEKQLRGFVLQADRSLESKVFSNVGDALRALENQEFIWGYS
jgi:hypothetical protein